MVGSSGCAIDYKTLFAPEFGVKDGGLALPKGVIAGVYDACYRAVRTGERVYL